jgi:hypothetical protein
MKYNHPNKVLRRAMLEVAPRVEELTGLRAPRSKGRHPIHPRIHWIGDIWHSEKYGFYSPVKRMIGINMHFAADVAHPDLITAVIAHEYVHYLQDIYWTKKAWEDIYNLEKYACEIESHFVPEPFQIDWEKSVEKYKTKRNGYVD